MQSGGEGPLQSIKVNAVDINLFAFRSLCAVYKSGYDEVELQIGDGSSIKDLSRQMTAMLPGYEIVDQFSNTCVIKNISKGLDSEFDTILRKIFLITKTMASNTLTALKDKKISKLDDTLTYEETANRFCNFCERMLNKRGYKDAEKTSFVYNIIWELEKVSDELKYMNIYLLNKKNARLSPELLDIFENVIEMLNTFYEAFYKYDPKKIQKIAEMRKKLISELNNRFEDKKADPKIIHHLINMTQMIFNMMGSYLGTKF